ncbi:MAG: M56 family metallopeptidase [Xanthomonadales bacterium]|nr:M56 family metallopeptidase [Xanthomonadales bacterium]
MTDYLLLNTLLSALMGGILWSLGDTPPRSRFWICLLALGCWLVPWSLIDLSLLIPQTVSAPALIWWEATEAATQSSVQATASGRIEPLTLFLLAGTLGLMVFLLRLVGQAMHLKKLAYRSFSGESLWAATGVSRMPGVSVRIVPGLRNAFISGYRKPIVWVGQELVSSDFLVGVLRHECTHIQQNDNYYRLLIGAIRHMFWWNPIVAFFGARANEYIELSCDQRCQQLDQRYQTHLATALLERHTETATAATLSPFFGKAGFNLKRVKQLDKRFAMTFRHKIIAGTGLMLSAFIAISPRSATQRSTKRKHSMNFRSPQRMTDRKGPIAQP